MLSFPNLYFRGRIGDLDIFKIVILVEFLLCDEGHVICTYSCYMVVK